MTRFQKGQPSANPLGRGAPFARAEIAKAAKNRPPGSDGVVAYGGYISSGEGNAALTGRQKWVTYANAIHEAVVGTGVRLFGNLLAGTEWHCEPNEHGGKDADRGVEIVTEGLIGAQLGKPWSAIVRKAALYRLFGFSLHATSLKRRNDGLIVYSDIAHRPQHTIETWHRVDECSAWESVGQRTNAGTVFDIPLDECLYLVDDTLTDSPEGVGLLRHVIELVRRLGHYQRLEGKAFFEDMGGIPIARAPIEQIVGSLEGTEASTRVTSMTQNLQDAVRRRVKTPEEVQWLMLDSATYQGSDPNTISGIQKWGIEILKSETHGIAEVNTVIQRLQLEIARVLTTEFSMVGGGDSAGSFGMHEDKTAMFAWNLETTATEVGDAATRQLARRLVAANGLDPDTCTPRLVHAPISTESILTVTQALANITASGMQHDDPAIPVLRKRMRLPPPPDRDAELMMPRYTAPATPTDPDDGDEIDVAEEMADV